MAHVSVIIVNYNSGSFTAQLVESLRHERVTDAQGNSTELEILVVENDSPDDQSHWLDPLEAGDVQVLKPGKNLGYGGGCNLGGEHATGKNLLFMNPDVFVVPGSVDLLSQYLDAHPDAGQVGPKGWFDAHRFFNLPRIELPTLRLHLADVWRRTSRRRAAAFALRRSRNAFRIWSARQPQPEPVLAGYAFMMPADFAREMGPFDDEFPLYFEDSDLTRRVCESGRRCVLVPDSEMIHLFNKSAGQFAGESNAKHDFSQDLYFKKHNGRLGAWLARKCSAWVKNNGTRGNAHEFANFEDLGPLTEPPTFEIPAGTGKYVLELTVDPLFTLAVGRIDDQEPLAIPEGVWEHLDPAPFYVRCLQLPDLNQVHAWRFSKQAPLKPITGFDDFRRRFEQSYLPASLDQ